MAVTAQPEPRPAPAGRPWLAGLDRRGVLVGGGLVVLLLVLVYVGSEGLRWFDAALAGYLVGTLLAVFGTAYRYVVWVERPPTRALRARGWQAFWGSGRRLRNLARLPDVLWTRLVGQGFIRSRSLSRWIAHQCVFWGCVLAALVTFPLTFGWLHFESVGQDDARYRAFVAGLGTVEFESRSVAGWLMFHALDVAAVLVLVGVFTFLVRRLRDPGALAVERSGDFLVLAGLFAVSVTGLMLTVSSLWMDGRFYTFLTNVHAATVILGLLYIPFGKLFHIFQRPGTVGLAYTKERWAHEEAATCRGCGEPYAPATQVDDLRRVLPELGFDYRIDPARGGGDHLGFCPRCRRALVARAQSLRVGGFG
ncbi:MAG: hypothetical protein C0P77_015590 [Thermoanaerobacterales bacterium]|jgi:hypothetical protein|nr:MFS transporter [Thermoanaerobacterales bacterium]